MAATKPKTPKADKTNSPKGPTTTVGEWDFSGKEIDEVPAGIGRANNSQKLPFPWDKYAERTKPTAEHVPVKFWTDGRGYDAADVTAPKCRDRIRRSFYGWQSDEEHPERKKLYSLSFNDKYDGKTYLGTDFYFIVKKPAA